MTDELYTLYLDTFAMKLVGIDGDQMWASFFRRRRPCRSAR